MTEMPRKDVPPPLELVKERIAEALPPDVKDGVESGEVAIVDTRPPEQFEQSHIAGAVNVPAGENGADSHSEDFAASVADAAGGRPTVLYCNSGNRSARATDALTNEHGVKNATSLIGGITLWDDLGLPVEGELARDEDTEEAED